ncbi:zinc finger BED domain-containing protein RICESLEEPER 2-like protein [Tanacetum coccineum]
MSLTGHFIDNEWKLKKKILNFCRLDGHSGVDIGKGVESCVNEWGIDAILSISVDNASANDTALDFLRKIFAKKDNCLLNGKWIHIRCVAHILNLVVQDGIRVIDKSIANIRYAVKWIKKSGNRIEKFKRCSEIAKCDIIKNLILDVPTRWNSTYNMLEVAQAYEDAFDRYDLEDVNFGNALRKKGFLVPTLEDWNKARKLCEFLKIFYDVTLRISGTRYVTSHTLIVELSAIRELLRKQMICDVLGVPPVYENLYKIA